MELANNLLTLSDHQQLRQATTVTELPPRLQSLLEFTDAIQPITAGTKMTNQPTRLLFNSPALTHNSITCQSSPYQYSLPTPPGTQLPTSHTLEHKLIFTVTPPPTSQPASDELWADCAPTTLLIQSEHHFPLPSIDNTTRTPTPGTWLHSLLHQLLFRKHELLEHVPPHYLEDFPCLTDTAEFLQLTSFPHGQCYDPHLSNQPTSVTVSLSPTAYILATHTSLISIPLLATETRRGITVPKQALLYLRPAHRSLLGAAQATNTLFSNPPHPSLPPISVQNKTRQVRLGSNTGQRPTLQQLLDWSYHLLTTDSLLSQLSLTKSRPPRK